MEDLYAEREDFIEDYLMGRLSPAQQASFEAQMASDASLRAEVAIQKKILLIVRQARREELKDYMRRNGGQAGAPGRRLLWPLSIAAAILVAALTILLLRPASENGMAPAPQAELYNNEHGGTEKSNPSIADTKSEHRKRQQSKTESPADNTGENLSYSQEKRGIEHRNINQAPPADINDLERNSMAIDQSSWDIAYYHALPAQSIDSKLIGPGQDADTGSDRIKAVFRKGKAGTYSFNNNTLTLFEGNAKEIGGLYYSGPNVYLKFKNKFYKLKTGALGAPLVEVSRQSVVTGK